MFGRRSFVAIAIFPLLLLAMTSCSSDNDDSLAGTNWALTSYGSPGSASPPVREATIRFDESGTASGTTGCNSYSGEYKVDDNSLSIGPIAATEMACLDPPGIMEQESAFLRILSAVTDFELEADELTLSGPEGELTFGR